MSIPFQERKEQSYRENSWGFAWEKLGLVEIILALIFVNEPKLSALKSHPW